VRPVRRSPSEREPFRINLFHRPQRLAGQPGEGMNLFPQGERFISRSSRRAVCASTISSAALILSMAQSKVRQCIPFGFGM